MFNKISFTKNRFISAILSILICTLILSSCTSQDSSVINSSSQASDSSSIVKTSTKTEISVTYDSDDEDSSWNSSDASSIVLHGNSITSSGAGATVNGSKVTISSAGTYSISGTLTDGQIVVNTADKEIVRLILNGADITNSASAPIYVISAKKEKQKYTIQRSWME